MTFNSWIDKLFEVPPHKSRGKRRTGRRAPAPRARRPAHRLETLEDRLLLTTTFTVKDVSDNAGDQQSIRYAINHATSGDTIQIDSSLAGKTIVLTNGQLDISQNITIAGPAVNNEAAISGDTLSRVFDIHSGVNVTISNLTIEDGDAEKANGGGIYNAGTLTLVKSTVSGSLANGAYGKYGNTFANEGAGGGIYNSGTLNLVQSTISGNTSQGGMGAEGFDHALDYAGVGGGGGGGAALGGGVFNSGTLNVVNSTISGNTAVGGTGGSATDPGNFSTSTGAGTGGTGGGNGAFQKYNQGVYGGYQYAGFGGGGAGGEGANQAGSNHSGTSGGFGGGGGGGGAYTLSGLFPSSASGGSGGGYGGSGGTGGNSFDTYGSKGGAYSGGGGGGAGIGGGIFSKGTLTITSSTIAGNIAAGGPGGGITGGAVLSKNSTGQAGEGVAGGIYLLQGSAMLDSTIVAGNTVGGPVGGLSPDLRAHLFNNVSFSGSHNLVQNPSGATGLAPGANLLNVNPLLLPLANNGGPTETIEPQADSLVVGAGDPNAVSPVDGTRVTVDQTGAARPTLPAIGAVEHSGNEHQSPPIIASTGGPYILGTEQSALSLSAKVSDTVVGDTVLVSWDINGDGKPDATATVTSNGSIVTATATLTSAQLKALGVFNGSGLIVLNRFTVTVTAKDGTQTSTPATTNLTVATGPEGGLKNNGPALAGQLVTAQIFVPAGASDQGPLHYSIAQSQDELATTYAAAGTTDTQSFNFDKPGSYTVYGRMFQPDGVFSDYTTTIDVYAAGQQNAIVVDRIYNDLLGRAGSPNGADPGPAYWANQLAKGESAQEVALAIMSDGGGEYDAQVVNTAFQQYLHRSPDAQSLGYFVSLLQKGLTVEALDVDLVGSDEYIASRGGGTNDGFLNALYEDAFGRSPDAGGRTAFDAMLAAGVSRGQVADMVFGSTEYQHDLVESMFGSLLNRAADPAGLAALTAELNSGRTDQQVMAQIIGSEEFALQT